MTKRDVEKLFSLLEQLFPEATRKRKSPVRLSAWALALEPYAYEDVKAAAVEYARRKKFFPDIADLTASLSPVVNPSPREEGAPQERMRWRDDTWMKEFLSPGYVSCDPATRYAAEHGCTYGAAQKALPEAAGT